MNLLRSLAPRDRRTLLAGAAGIILILAFGRGLPELRARLAYESQAVVTARRQLAVTRALVADSARLRTDAIAATSQLTDLEARLLAATSPAAAAAALATVVERVASAERVRVGSSLTVGDTIFTGGFARIGVRAFVTADVPGLVRWIDRIERDPRGFVVRELTVSQPEPAADDHRPDALRVELVVEALVRPSGALRGSP